jgi:hypothetical protein
VIGVAMIISMFVLTIKKERSERTNPPDNPA